MKKTVQRESRMTVMAKVKICISFLLILLVAGILCACGSPAPEVPSDSDTSLAPAERVEVVYFHRAQRCSGCLYAETGVRYTLETYFKDKLSNGQVTLETFSLEDKENAAVIDKYAAFTSSLFINTIVDSTDHIEEVKDIWLLLGNDEEFVNLVKGRIEESLEGKTDGSK